MQKLQCLAVTTAVALSFSPLVQAGDEVPAHPLLSAKVGNTYTPNLYNAVNQATFKVTGSKTEAGLASGSAGGLVSEFEAALRKPLDRPQMVWFPSPKHLNGQPVPADIIVMGAVVPPAALYPNAASKNDSNYVGHPAFCAYVGEKVLWKGVVNAFNGMVTTDTSPNVIPAVGKSPCQPYLLAKGIAMQ